MHVHNHIYSIILNLCLFENDSIVIHLAGLPIHYSYMQASIMMFHCYSKTQQSVRSLRLCNFDSFFIPVGKTQIYNAQEKSFQNF